MSAEFPPLGPKRAADKAGRGSLRLEQAPPALDAISQEIERIRGPLAQRLQQVLDALAGQSLEPPEANVEIVREINALRRSLRLTLRLAGNELPVQLRCAFGPRQKNPTIQVVQSTGKRPTEYAGTRFPKLEVVVAEINQKVRGRGF